MRFPDLSPSSDVVSAAGRAAHDLGLAGLLGGNLFGQLGLHPAVAELRDAAERGKVVNGAWARYGKVNSLSLMAVTGGWVAARSGEARDAQLSPTERVLARVKDGLVAATFLTGAATAVEGVRFARSVPGGAVPLRDGAHAADDAPPAAAKLKRRLNRLGAANIAAEAGLVAVNAALTQMNFRRPAARRLLGRS